MSFDHLSLTPGIDLYRGDSAEVLEVLREQGVQVDLVASDPPYGIGYVGTHHKMIPNDEKPKPEYVAQMETLLKPGGAMYLCTRFDVMGVWEDAMVGAGLEVRSNVVWDKMAYGTGDALGDLAPQVEMILYGTKGEHLIRGGDAGSDEERLTDLWHIAVPRTRRAQRHPTSKPPELFEYMLVNSSDEGDVVLDPFMGGGPAGVAAIRLGRRYIGVDLSEADGGYFSLGVENIQRALAERTAVQRLRAVG